MSRIKKLFTERKEPVLNVFCTAGYPYGDSTMEVIISLQESGVDMVEIGMPYSDPLADGPVIQESNTVALNNGMSIEKLFNELEGLRKDISIPVVLMGYFNPLLQYGFERFCAEAERVGVDGLIIPDLPDHAFEKYYGAIIGKYSLDFIFLVTPETPEHRVRKLDELSSGFLYAVSSSSITGTDRKWYGVKEYLQRLAGYQLQNPVLLGFGVKDREGFDIAATYAQGAIIGSAFVKALEGTKDIRTATSDFIKKILTGKKENLQGQL
jgi:tryptophan synthase alpha chain